MLSSCMSISSWCFLRGFSVYTVCERGEESREERRERGGEEIELRDGWIDGWITFLLSSFPFFT